MKTLEGHQLKVKRKLVAHDYVASKMLQILGAHIYSNHKFHAATTTTASFSFLIISTKMIIFNIIKSSIKLPLKLI